MPEQVLERMFDAIQSLTHEAHLYRSFNIKQLEAADVTKQLLNAFLVTHLDSGDVARVIDAGLNELVSRFQERIQAEAPPLRPRIADVTIAIISDVMQRSFQRVRHVTLLWDFLLLAHPAASTFVQHRPDQFYFRSNRRTDASSGH